VTTPTFLDPAGGSPIFLGAAMSRRRVQAKRSFDEEEDREPTETKSRGGNHQTKQRKRFVWSESLHRDLM